MDISPWLSWVWNHGRIGRVKLLGPWSRRFCCCYTILHKMLGYCNYCIWSWPIATSRIHTYACLGMHEHDWNTFWDAYGWSNFCGPRITVTIQNFQPYQQHLSSVQNSSWLMIIGVYTSHIVDGRNPAPPWLGWLMGCLPSTNWRRISSIHSIYLGVAQSSGGIWGILPHEASTISCEAFLASTGEVKYQNGGDELTLMT